ncbi:hypothetical protein OKW24_002718 [Peribacillus simplex]|nr:hypothetical protein [Peribacillus simplex]
MTTKIFVDGAFYNKDDAKIIIPLTSKISVLL